MKSNATDRVQEQLTDLKDAYSRQKDSAGALADATIETSKEAVGLAEEWVRSNCLKLFGVALAAGFLFGWRFCRRPGANALGPMPR